MNLWKRKSCSAMASTIFEFHLHCPKRNFPWYHLCNLPMKVITQTFWHPVMKWPLVKSKLHIFILFSQQSSHLFIDSIRKEPDLTVPGIWPLCYSWIGYLQANGSPWVLLSNFVDHDFSCQHRVNAYNSNLKCYQRPFRMLSMIYLFLWQKSAVYCLFLLNYPSHHGQMAVKSLPPWRCEALLTGRWTWCTSYTNRGLILSVIIPHTKHASSLAIAATATFLAFPCLINL